MYDQIREDPLFIIFYTLVTGMALMASCYLLFRRGNAFAPDIVTPARLRRWTGLFFAAIALNHVWYMPILYVYALLLAMGLIIYMVRAVRQPLHNSPKRLAPIAPTSASTLPCRASLTMPISTVCAFSTSY